MSYSWLFPLNLFSFWKWIIFNYSFSEEKPRGFMQKRQGWKSIESNLSQTMFYIKKTL